MRSLFPQTLKSLLLAAGLTAASGCNKSGDRNSFLLKATVISTADINCGKPVLDFSDDAERIRKLTGQTFIIYNAGNLSVKFNVVGQKLFVLVDPAPPVYACITYGIALPGVQLRYAIARE